jgi:hypothetical protein
MQAGQLVVVRTDPATQFTEAIAQNAMAELTLTMPQAGDVAGAGFVDGGLAAGGSVRSRIKSIIITSVESLDWVVWLWGNDTFADANPANAQLLGFAALAAASAKRIAATGLYYYVLTGLDIVYEDLMGAGQIYLGLQPTSAGKSVGAAGSVVVQLVVEPTLGW